MYVLHEQQSGEECIMNIYVCMCVFICIYVWGGVICCNVSIYRIISHNYILEHKINNLSDVLFQYIS